MSFFCCHGLLAIDDVPSLLEGLHFAPETVVGILQAALSAWAAADQPSQLLIGPRTVLCGPQVAEGTLPGRIPKVTLDGQDLPLERAATREEGGDRAVPGRSLDVTHGCLRGGRGRPAGPAAWLGGAGASLGSA